MSDEQAPGKSTRRVRVLVMIDPNGRWEANGSASYSDKEAREQLENLCGDMRPLPWEFHWIEADVPVPVQVHSEAIEGEVSEAE